MIASGFVPPILMIIFSVLTLQNLRNIRSSLKPMSSNRESHQRTRTIRRRDIDLIKMVFIEVMFYVITTLPFSVSLIYKSVTDAWPKSQERKKVESFIYYMLQQFMLHINTTVPFYIYVATSNAFRQELKRVFIRLYGFTAVKRKPDGLDTRRTTSTAIT